MHAQSLSCVQLFATPWTVAHQAPLSVRFPKQEWWNGWPFPPLEDLPDPGIEPASPTAPDLAAGFFTAESTGKPITKYKRQEQKPGRIYQHHSIHSSPWFLTGLRLKTLVHTN